MSYHACKQRCKKLFLFAFALFNNFSKFLSYKRTQFTNYFSFPLQMHSLSFDTKTSNKDGGDVLVSVATLITESRIPGNLKAKSKKFYEGPHCTLIKGTNKGHRCDLNNSLVSAPILFCRILLVIQGHTVYNNEFVYQ